jgi:polyhydroxyalkanoate synthesis regulator phasin
MVENETTMSDKLKESLEQAQSRLASFEEEAQRVLIDLVAKGRATRKEVAALIARINAPELLEADYVKGISGKAKNVGEDMSRRVEDVRQRMITLAGVASREQVDDLTRDLEKLSRKLDRLLTASKKPAATKAPKPKGAGGSKAR